MSQTYSEVHKDDTNDDDEKALQILEQQEVESSLALENFLKLESLELPEISHSEFLQGCLHGNRDVIEKYLKSQQTLNCVMPFNKYGCLHLLVHFPLILEEVLNGRTANGTTCYLVRLNVNLQDIMGLTPLHHAMHISQFESAKILLDSGECRVNSVDSQQETPLFLAARKGNFKLMKLLVRNSARIDIRNDEQKIPIDYYKLDPVKPKSKQCIDTYLYRKVTKLKEKWITESDALNKKGLDEKYHKVVGETNPLGSDFILNYQEKIQQIADHINLVETQKIEIKEELEALQAKKIVLENDVSVIAIGIKSINERNLRVRKYGINARIFRNSGLPRHTGRSRSGSTSSASSRRSQSSARNSLLKSIHKKRSTSIAMGNNNKLSISGGSKGGMKSTNGKHRISSIKRNSKGRRGSYQVKRNVRSDSPNNMAKNSSNNLSSTTTTSLKRQKNNHRFCSPVSTSGTNFRDIYYDLVQNVKIQKLKNKSLESSIKKKSIEYKKKKKRYNEESGFLKRKILLLKAENEQLRKKNKTSKRRSKVRNKLTRKS